MNERKYIVVINHLVVVWKLLLTNIIDKINIFFGYQFVKDIRIILIKERIDPKKDKILTNKKDSKYQKNLAKIQNPELKKKINNLINAFSNKK